MIITMFGGHKLLVFTVVSIALFFGSGKAAALGQYTSGGTGIDVSYPNCTASIPSTGFGVAGVTGGRGFSSNSCLAAESSHFSNLSLYVNTGYPGLSFGLSYQNYPKICSNVDLGCLAYNYGYNAGQYALNFAKSQKVWSQTWWEDVETTNSWVNDPSQNIQSLQGQHDALAAAGATSIGVYSTTVQWNEVTGGWKNLWPSWGATTWNSAKQAATYCTGHQFTGGPSYLMQYKGRTLDQDYAC